MLLPSNTLDKLSMFFYGFKDVELENSMYTSKICEDRDEVHWYDCEWYLNCPKTKIPHSELELRNNF